MTEYSILGKRPARVDGLAKVTGKAVYTADISLPNMLCGKILRSPYAHANIRRLDVSKAKALQGVKAVVTADDVPGQQGGRELSSDLPAMAKEKAFFAGQPVAAVAAIDARTAERALELIEVDYEILDPVTDALDGMKPDAPIIHQDLQSNMASKKKESMPNNVAWHKAYGRGDVDAGFKTADIVLEKTYRTQRVHQGYLETRSSVASIGLDGKITIWCDSQGIFKVREHLSDYLNLPVSRFKVMPVEVGGAFGGKNLHPLSPICALLCLKSGCPVKMVTTRQEELIATRPAPDSIITVKLGADKEGHILAASATSIFDIGAFARGELRASVGGITNALSCYVIPNLKVECYDIFTNKAPFGAYRAPSTPQAVFAVESQMDTVAQSLGMDPLELRMKNAVEEGDLTADGAPFPRIGLKEALQKMKQYLSIHGKLEGENRGRGIACGLWRAGFGNSSCHINVNADGTVVIAQGAVDLTGVRTSFAQIVAEEFGIPLRNVIVTTGDTETAPHSDISAGSRTTRAMGSAILAACQDVKAQLIQHATSLLDVKSSDLELVNGCVRVINSPDKCVSISDLATSAISKVGEGPITGRGSAGLPRCPMFAVGMADVEVDRETGKVRLLSYVTAQDVGFALNPTLIEGQVQGAVAQGTGWALMEGYSLSGGVVQNPNFLDYRLPTAVDLPFLDTLLVEVKDGPAAFGMRGAGEPPITPCLAAIANAVHSAVGIRLTETPMTPERVFWALRGKE